MILTKEFLEKELETKTIKEIAESIGYHQVTVRKKCKEFNIAYKWNRQHKRKNITRIRFGKLVAQKYHESDENGRAYWECRCDCGEICYKNSKYLLDGSVTTCGKCTYERELLPYWYYNQIQINAKRRNLEFDVSREYLEELFLEQNCMCYYSGLKLELPQKCNEFRKNKHHTNYASLDRTDSLLGYVKNNVKWVNKNVNLMKHAMPESQFLKLCLMIGNNYEKRKDACNWIEWDDRESFNTYSIGK